MDNRSYTDYKEFPGKLSADKTVYEFPELTSIDAKDRKRVWKIRLRIVKDNNRQKGYGWNLLEETAIPILDEYFNDGADYVNLPKGSIAQVWSEGGIIGGKITRNSPTYFDKIKNKGKSNQRNLLHSALIYARDHWIKRKRKGGTKSKTGNVIGTKLYFPMLAESYKKGEKHLKYPLYVQPKLDGNRCLIFLRVKKGQRVKDTSEKDVIVYSRQGNVFPDKDYLQILLHPYLEQLYDEEKKVSFYFDGELYIHGKKLQDIVGDSRRGKSNKKKYAERNKLKPNEYHIYDGFYPDEMSTPYKDRKEQIENIFVELSSKRIKRLGYSEKDLLKSVPTHLAKTKKDVIHWFDYYTKKCSPPYEGVILRNSKAPYLGSNQKVAGTRSKELVKLKAVFSAEYPVVDYTQGRGKDSGAVIWICETEKGKRFKVTPNLSLTDRYEIFKECVKNFDKKYNGRLLTIEYRGKSKDDVPQHAKGIIFRDYE